MSRTYEAKVHREKVTLSGSLVLSTPNHKSIAVLMLHGSGPLDRNANMEGQNLHIFNVIADALERVGINSYRYDKRGCGDSSGDYNTASFSDLIDDACAAVDMLASVPCIEGIVLLGHSEGTIIAPVVAHLKPKVIGLVLLCPTIQPVEDTLMRQADNMAERVATTPGIRGAMARFSACIRGGIPRRQRKLIDRIKASESDTFTAMGQHIPSKMLRELFAHDPKSWIAKVQVPVLAIAGANDIQCLPSDAKSIENMAQGPVETHCLRGLTHILRADDAPASFDRYDELMTKELDPRISQLCIKWILLHYFHRRPRKVSPS
ncbi:alpha/beta hydrolase [Meridianimarinicoccus aquatilis]|uniref:Alpha/beta fold hydrolase n=1 Tax=Meridianimarinicoccus aquatilis TaxID=2552766 RepID=A0A4R6B4Q1_9RHOB|nr:alpha/beta fold hydrolase [Fluviibacterium aquatile]TDL90528.1 alpha/beta fold hydrolase [Fluviibacterium aquatile]